MNAIKDILRQLLHPIIAILLGQERQRRKQEEKARELEKQMRDISDRPDLPRDELYERMRKRNRSVPPVSGSPSGGGRYDV